MKMLSTFVSSLAKNAEDALARRVLPLVQGARCFVFEAPPTGEFSENVQYLDLPFPTVSIEMADGRPTWINRPQDGSGEVSYDHTFIHESAPGSYLVLSSFFRNRNGVTEMGVREWTGEDKAFALQVVQAFLAQLRTSCIATESVREKVKVRINGAKENVMIREVIHVRKEKFRTQGGLYGGPVDYSHRFEVRGHWRQIKGIGKDRAGSYSVKGMTWVVPFVKGPESKPLVRKQRVIHAQ
jgi:hypothetical protein